MQIEGLWLPDEAGTMCPSLMGIVVISGREYPAQFLVDTGADQTVLGSDFAQALEPYRLAAAGVYLTSAAGNVSSFSAMTRLLSTDTTKRRIGFELTCSVLDDPTQATTHLLGREVLDNFALIPDREGDVVTLLRPPHTHTIIG